MTVLNILFIMDSVDGVSDKLTLLNQYFTLFIKFSGD